MKEDRNPKYLCDEDCNHCEAINNRQVSLALNALYNVFGDGVYQIVQGICPNLTCCADCHIDDFTHITDDDGEDICEIEIEARRIARKWFRAHEKKGGAEYVLKIREGRKGFHIDHTLHCEGATPGEALGVSTIREFVASLMEEFMADDADGGARRPRREGGAQ